MRRIAGSLVVGIACLGLAIGCRKERPPPARPVAECLSSMQRAAEGATVGEVTSTYYSGCAEMFTAKGCQDAWKQAASAPLEQQMSIVATACRKAYCPDMAAFSLSICRDDFQPTKEALDRDWPKLLEAMVSREAQSYAADLQPGFLAVYVRTTLLADAEKAAAALKKLGDGGAPPAPSGSVAPAASASAAPAASAAESKKGAAPAASVSAAKKPAPAPASSK